VPSLSQTPLPKLLLGLARDGFTGTLTLRSGAAEKRFGWQAGAPVSVDSSDPADGLLAVLVAAGSLAAEDVGAVEACMREKGWDALRATAALQKASPGDLVRGLAHQIESALGNVFAWSDGVFEMDVAGAPGDAPVLPLTVAGILALGIARHWPVERALAELGERATWMPAPGDGFAQHLAALGPGRVPEGFAEALDGQTSAFGLCQARPRPETWATLVVLDALGALQWSAEPGTAEPVSAETAPPQIEIRIAAAARDHADDTAARMKGPGEDDLDDRAIALRDEILGLHARLPDIDHYELLGIDRDANHAQIKRAYLKAAKRLHPDRASNLGIGSVKEAANEVFARITRAHGVLSDVDERRSYDASLEGHTEVDADRVAQAEVFFRKGETLLKAGNFLGAVDLLDAAVQVWPDEADYQAALAWALHRKNPPENERALEHFEQALALGDGDAQTLLRMSFVVKEMGDLERAGQLAQQARSIDPGVAP